MFWSKKRKEMSEVAKQVTSDVMAHKKAETEEVQKTKEAAKDLNRMLENNGITLVLYAGMGGKHGR